MKFLIEFHGSGVPDRVIEADTWQRTEGWITFNKNNPEPRPETLQEYELWIASNTPVATIASSSVRAVIRLGEEINHESLPSGGVYVVRNDTGGFDIAKCNVSSHCNNWDCNCHTQYRYRCELGQARIDFEESRKA